MVTRSVLLVHGFNGVPEVFRWLGGELAKEGADVVLPEFPPREGVVYDDWARVLDGYRHLISANSIVVCHSIGNEFFIRYLVRNKLKIDTFIGLAGFAEAFSHEGKDVLNNAVKNFLVDREELAQFTRLADNRFAIYSDNDHVVPLDALERFPVLIDAEPMMIPGIGHMGKKSGMREFPELLRLVERFVHGA